MATIINASNSSGLVQTADTSGILQLQTNGVTALQVDASQNVTFTNAVSASSMTLLGTITPTAVNSISLGSLTLTPYKNLYIVFNGIEQPALAGTQVFYISSNNQQSGGGGYVGSKNQCYGSAWLDLGTGAISGTVSESTPNGASTIYACGGLTNVSTSSTTIYFRWSGTNAFAALGTILIYGVK